VLRLLAAHPPGLLLDIPAGAGPVRDGARQLGYGVIEADLFPAPGFRGVAADACAPFPFADARFDALLCMEGIEHLENQAGFLRECARVLRPGGQLILTTPNVLHLGARLSAFFTGQRLLKQGFINEITTLRGRNGDHLYHGHAFLIDVFRLRYLLRIVGLQLDAVHATSLSSTSVLLSPLVPLIWCATRYALWSGRRRQQRKGRTPALPAVERELAHLAASPALLWSRGLIVTAHRDTAAT
jgi:SAM-dependent methyltransferase